MESSDPTIVTGAGMMKADRDAARRTLRVNSDDDLVVALTDLEAGTEADLGAGRRLVLEQRVPAKHKFAIRELAVGERVRMYGIVIGRVAQPIPAGGLVTTSNLEHDATSCQGKLRTIEWKPPQVERWIGRTFAGYHRSNGRVGTANDWLVVPLVFCENRNLEVLREAFDRVLGRGRSSFYEDLLEDLVARHRRGDALDGFRDATGTDRCGKELETDGVFPNIDGVKFLSHGLGCGGTRDDAKALCGLLAGYITHPNVAGATILSLGCQNAQVALLEEAIAEREPNHDRPLLIFEQQRWPSERAMLTEAIRATFRGLVDANAIERRAASVSKLILGVECGGSDGFSGISANPAIGYAADCLVACGGSAILSEFPELCGVEQELADRCETESLATRFLELMSAYQERARAVGSGFDANPSPGNIRDGLITDAMKSAGAARKGGTSPVIDVLDYPGQVRRSGLTLLCTPGNDVESTTAMAGAGANLMVFSTGLGTPTGNPVVPVVKVSTNTGLAKRMPDIIDFDAGPVVDGTSSVEEVGAELLEQLIRVAEGSYRPHAVRLGQDDFLPWKRGVSL